MKNYGWGSMVQKEVFQNESALVLENSQVRVVCLPEFGGKLVSYYDKYKNKEFLFQNPHTGFQHATVGSDFSKFEACGLDDAFPSVDAGIVHVADSLVHYPDHGELWSASFAEKHSKEDIHLCYTSALLPYRYEKTYSLTGAGLRIDYAITNTGEVSFPCIWTLHCLLAYEPDMELLFPAGSSAAIAVLPGSLLGERGAVLPFPLLQSPEMGLIDLRKVDAPCTNGMEKYYLHHPVSEGRCGVQYHQSQTILWFTYDEKKLPYLGFWKTLGGYRGDYNCALEPTNGFYDSIEQAQKNTACPLLLTGSTFKFSLHIQTEYCD